MRVNTNSPRGPRRTTRSARFTILTPLNDTRRQTRWRDLSKALTSPLRAWTSPCLCLGRCHGRCAMADACIGPSGRVRHGALLASAARHGASTARHGASAARHGASTARHGASAARHGASTARHGDALTRALRRLYSKSPDVASPPAIMPRRVTLTTAHAPLTTALHPLTTARRPLTLRPFP